jgi:histone-arginine methyltransferase CARM1
MLADHVRTSTYQEAFQRNSSDFADKVVLDVGTGSGILAFFAVQCGASYVYAVDASDSIEIAKKLAEANGMSDRITFIKGKVEEISLPEQVDIIISEPIGFLLVHERMLESFVIARDKFLKPGGLMMPTVGSIIVAPFSDQAIHNEQMARMELWRNQNFYGIDLSSVADIAIEQYLAQPIVGDYIHTYYYYYQDIKPYRQLLKYTISYMQRSSI